MRILNSYSEVLEARKELKARKLSSLSFFQNNFFLRIVNFFKIPVVLFTAINKSWDIINTINFVDKFLNKNSKILDVGCYASEILPILKKKKYKNLYGIDLDPRIKFMPHQSIIKYKTENFFFNTYKDNFFDAITCLSVIEHGYDEHKFFSQFSRVIKNGGYLIITFDYWEKKIDTTGIKMFDLDWKIFSKNEVLEMIKNAKNKYNLNLLGEINLSSNNEVINCAKKNYTFACLIFKKIYN